MNDLQDLYQDIIMDHNRRPRNFGPVDQPTHKKEGYNPLCGDQIEIELKILDGIVVDVGFTGVGCAISKSSASMMTEEIKGKKLEVVESMFEQFRRMITVNDQMDLDADLLGDLEILQGVSRYPARIKCATLAWHTLHSAIEGDENTVTTE
jgi:nitrogen fixation NifU-like protein